MMENNRIYDPNYDVMTPSFNPFRSVVGPLGHSETANWDGLHHAMHPSMMHMPEGHVPCYSQTRRSEQDRHQHKNWMHMMSGGFTQACSNWSLLKILIPEKIALEMLNEDGLLPLMRLLEKRTDSAISISKTNQTLELNDSDCPRRLLLIGSLRVNRLVYLATYLVELMYHYFMPEESSTMKQFFNLKCVLPRSSISRFIGRGGETIRTVQEESTLTMSVSTLNHSRSERILNIGLCYTCADPSYKLDSLLSVFQVICNVLQTDRNYSMNYEPIAENTGRVRILSPRPTREDLATLLKVQDSKDAVPKAHHLEDLCANVDAIQDIQTAARHCLKKVFGASHHINGLDQMLFPCVTAMIDAEHFSDRRARDCNPLTNSFTCNMGFSSMGMGIGMVPKSNSPLVPEWMNHSIQYPPYPFPQQQNDSGAFNYSQTYLRDNSTSSSTPTHLGNSIARFESVQGSAAPSSPEVPILGRMSNLSTGKTGISQNASHITLKLQIDYADGSVSGQLAMPLELQNILRQYKSVEQLNCRADQVAEEFNASIEQATFMHNVFMQDAMDTDVDNHVNRGILQEQKSLESF